TDYFWFAPSTYEAKAVAKHTNEHTPEYLTTIRNVVDTCLTFTEETLENAIKAHIAEQNFPMGKVMNSLRLALVGESRGINVAAIMAFLGKEATLQRIDAFVRSLS
ncbi:MAG: glutamate--tRNA ligase, partial [Bacteroides sp.]